MIGARLKELILPISTAGLLGVAFTYIEMMYWADSIAKYSNYFISTVFVPIAFTIVCGDICSRVFPDVRAIQGASIKVTFLPVLFPVALIIYTFAVLQWGQH